MALRAAERAARPSAVNHSQWLLGPRDRNPKVTTSGQAWHSQQPASQPDHEQVHAEVEADGQGRERRKGETVGQK